MAADQNTRQGGWVRNPYCCWLLLSWPDSIMFSVHAEPQWLLFTSSQSWPDSIMFSVHAEPQWLLFTWFTDSIMFSVHAIAAVSLGLIPSCMQNPNGCCSLPASLPSCSLCMQNPNGCCSPPVSWFMCSCFWCLWSILPRS